MGAVAKAERSAGAIAPSLCKKEEYCEQLQSLSAAVRCRQKKWKIRDLRGIRKKYIGSPGCASFLGGALYFGGEGIRDGVFFRMPASMRVLSELSDCRYRGRDGNQ